MNTPEKEQLRLQWLTQFRKAQQADSWGQVLEAQEEYHQLAATMAAKQSLHFMNSKEKETCARVVLCLSARVTALRMARDSIEDIGPRDMKALEGVFEVLMTGREPDTFPIEPRKFQGAQPVTPSADGEILCGDIDENDNRTTDWQQSQAVLRTVTGTVVGIRIEKIGLKDAQDYIDPFMTVLVADPRTQILDTHDKIVAKERRATHVVFNHQIYLNVSREDMELSQAALFFEFKHYKPKKKKVSTRCWAFMELPELKADEEIVLELYHKPTDLKKKHIKLHTEKPLYLHIWPTFMHA